jgi:nucleoid-associated protein YgaU
MANDATGSSGTKTLLKLTRYTVSTEGTITIDTANSFTVMINPAEISHTRKISYDQTKAQGEVAPDKKFSAVEPETLSFSVTLDGTGVVAPPTGGAKEVMELVNDLKKVVYDYVGTKHEPSRVRVLWGTVIFFGRLETLTTKYTLFKPSGAPLRAKLDLSFVGSMSKEEAALTANRSSPDLSHLVDVRQGDTLPLLCHRIYGDPGYYLDVARFNNLVDFRHLEPGRKLHFPPLE